MFVCFSQLAFFLIWLRRFFIEFLIIVYQKNRDLFSIVTCGLVNRKSFYDQYIAAENPDF